MLRPLTPIPAALDTLCSRAFWLGLCLSTGACVSGSALQADDPQALPEQVVPEQRFLVHLGSRSLDDSSFYEPVDQPVVLGIEALRDFSTDAEQGLGLEYALFLANDSDDILGVDVSSTFIEISVGLRGRVDLSGFELFAGVGPALVLAAIDIENGPEEDDGSLGLYYHAGVLYNFRSGFLLGLDARALTGTDISYSGFVDTDADYSQVCLLLGWSP